MAKRGIRLRSVWLVALIGVSGCHSKQVRPQKSAFLGGSWWIVDKGSSSPLLRDYSVFPDDSVLHLKTGGTYVSQGFFGTGSWSASEEEVVLSPREKYLPSLVLQHGYPKPANGPQSIRLDRSGGGLRLALYRNSAKSRYWIGFVPYRPSTLEVQQGPQPPSPARMAYLMTPEWKKRLRFLNAVEKGDAPLVERLLKGGADPNGPASELKRFYRYSYTPLLIAVERRHAKAARALLERGADPNAAMEMSVTPLMMAALHNAPDCVAELLRFHADPSKRDVFGETAYDIAKRYRNAPVLNVLEGK